MDVEGLISLTNKARAEAMVAEAVADGLVKGQELKALPEAAPFGEAQHVALHTHRYMIYIIYIYYMIYII